MNAVTTAFEPKIQEYSKTAAALAQLRERYQGVVYDVTTTAGMKTAKEARAEVRTIRVALENLRKELKAPALERSRLIDDEAKRITAALLEIEEPIDTQIKAEEERKKAEKAAKEAEERARVATILERIASIRNRPAEFIGKTSAEMRERADFLERFVITDEEFAEFTEDAEKARWESVNRLKYMAEEQMEREKEAERLAAERAELERLRAEQERLETERKRLDAERERLDAERRAEEERQAQQARRAEEERLRAEREAHEAKLRAEREAEEARLKAERAAEEARLKAEREAHEEKMRVEREKARQEAEERAAKEAAERAAKREQERAEQEAARVERRRLELAGLERAVSTQELDLPTALLMAYELGRAAG